MSFCLAISYFFGQLIKEAAVTVGHDIFCNFQLAADNAYYTFLFLQVLSPAKSFIPIFPCSPGRCYQLHEHASLPIPYH